MATENITTPTRVLHGCTHDRSCPFVSGTGWCLAHCREFGCEINGSRVRHLDRRGEKRLLDAALLDNDYRKGARRRDSRL